MARITFDDLDTLARTIYGEARGEPAEGQLAVGLVVCRRWRNARARGRLADVCRRPWQFSCWNADDPNRARVLAAELGDPAFRAAWRAALAAIDTGEDAERALTGAATHYMTRALFDTAPPRWAAGHDPVAEIGAHVFFAGID